MALPFAVTAVISFATAVAVVSGVDAIGAKIDTALERRKARKLVAQASKDADKAVKAAFAPLHAQAAAVGESFRDRMSKRTEPFKAFEHGDPADKAAA